MASSAIELLRVLAEKNRQKEGERREWAQLEKVRPEFPAKWAIYLAVKFPSLIDWYGPSVTFSSFLSGFTLVDPEWKEAEQLSRGLSNILQAGKIGKIFGTVGASAFRHIIAAELLLKQEKEQGTMTAASQPFSVHQEVIMKIDTLREHMLKDTPALPGILAQIRKYLGANPDCVVLLSEEDIGAVVQASIQHSKIKVVEAAVSGTRKKSLKNLSADDLGLDL